MQKTHIKVIAEMAWSHDGSIDKAIQILTGAKQAGADALGIHVTSLEDYMVPHYGNGTGKVSAGKEHLKIYQYLNDINLSFEDWLKLKSEAQKQAIALCVMPNDHKSLTFAQQNLDPAYYVISAASFVEKNLILEIAKQHKPTLFRIGGATLAEIESTLDLFQRESRAEVILLHGFQNYPTPIENLNISQLTTLKHLFGVTTGLADHIDGGDPLALSLPLLAVSLGVEYIEKHITLNREEEGEDFESALDPNSFKTFVELIRAAETALGNPYWQGLPESAMRYRDISRKKIVAAHSLDTHCLLTESDFTFKRSDVGLTPDKLEQVLGRHLNKPLQKNDAITLEDLLA